MGVGVAHVARLNAVVEHNLQRVVLVGWHLKVGHKTGKVGKGVLQGGGERV